MNSKTVFKRGLLNGLHTTWILGKITVPVTFFVSVLQCTPAIGWIVQLFRPLMGIVGLPGQAAIPLTFGMFVNLYAGVGALLSIGLLGKQAFILATMMAIAHGLFVETAVVKAMRVSALSSLAVRIGMAFLAGVLLNWLWPGGNPTDQAVNHAVTAIQYQHAAGILPVVKISLLKALTGLYQLAIIVIPVLLAIEFLKAARILEYLTIWLEPLVCKIFGMSKESVFPLLAGIIVGLSFGSGVIQQSIKEHGLSKRDVYFLMFFLCILHAVFEDTLIFVPAGVNPWALVGTRLVLAIVFMLVATAFWRPVTEKVEHSQTLKIE